MPRHPSTIEIADAAKWRALCAFLTDAGWTDDQIEPVDVATAALAAIDMSYPRRPEETTDEAER